MINHPLLSCPIPSWSQETGFFIPDLSQGTGNYPASRSILHGLCSLLIFQCPVPYILGVQNSAGPKVGSELKPKEDWWE